MGELFHIPKIKSENKQPSKVMNRDQVIDFFGISKSTLYRWSNVENKLPYIKINRRKFFKREDIENLMESNYSTNI
mgnify:FL=1|tara:strand:- start:673 stop:900 length:228 start_codon:yes stop_codon:yes gene_type:complete